jgi:hypothetical protein
VVYASRREKVDIPIESDRKEISGRMNSQSTRSRFHGTITADGTQVKSLVIIGRDAVEYEFFDFGYTPDAIHYP